MKNSLPGINVQWPYSEMILNGEKSIETRTYPLPEKYLNKDLYLIETPGKTKNFKARATCIIKFNKCIIYKDKTEFYKDSHRHLVDKDSEFSWEKKNPKWGWQVEVVKRIKPRTVKPPKGIRFTASVSF